MMAYLHGLLAAPMRLLTCLCLLPVLGGALALLPRGRLQNALRLALVPLFSLANLLFALALYLGGPVSGALAFGVGPLKLAFAADGLSALMLLTAAGVFLLVSLYAVSWFRNKEKGGAYLFLLFLSLGMLNGALLSDNLAMLLFFWEGLLCTLFGILLIGRREKPRAAIKALALSGTADLLLMLGIIATANVAGSMNMSEIFALPVAGLGALGCACMLLGAMGKAGAMPFHSWIPEAALSAPAPFLSAFPGALEKIAGVYLMLRVTRGLYAFEPGSPMSVSMMCLGAVTLFFGVAMALIQKDMRRLLSYHAISQVGYMVLGIGSGLFVGVLGAVFHMINNVLYKSGLFIAAGAIEDRTGTTDLNQLGGLGKHMPGTMAAFFVFALSIAGFPGSNGFFSKELIFDAALESGVVFYILALLGAFMTAASFLKMCGAAFFGPLRLPLSHKNVREAPWGMVAPLMMLAGGCVFFGLNNAFPLDALIAPALGGASGHSGWPENTALVLISLAVLLLALLDHLYGRRRDKSALAAADHIHYAPGIRQLYALAQAGKLDPYNWLMAAAGGFSKACQWVEDGVSWFYDRALPGLARGVANALGRFWNGSISRYLVIALAGVGFILLIFLAVML